MYFWKRYYSFSPTRSDLLASDRFATRTPAANAVTFMTKSKVPPSDSSSKKIKFNIFNRDVFGRTVLHVTVLCDQPELMSQVLRTPEAKLILLATDCENGWNVLHYILYHKRFRCLAVLQQYLDKTLVGNSSILHELLKKKDRGGVPPLFLLRNDIKDFVWIPTYINEHNEYHLQYRYPEHDGEDVSTQRMRRSWQLDHIMWSQKRGASDIYVMGSNVNHSLGVGDSTDRSVPVKISHKMFQPLHSDMQLFLQKPRYRELRISKYHSVALTTDGRLFTCGLASKGRLGLGNSKNSFSFSKVNFFEEEGRIVSQVVISTGHNLVLTTSNEVYGWGLNEFNQLGFTSSDSQQYRMSSTREFQNLPLLIANGELRKNANPLVGIAASKIHSVAYTDDTIYMWGLNIGQMGMEAVVEDDYSLNLHGTIFRGKVIEQPKSLSFKEKVQLIATCETCTCIATDTNDIFVFYQHHRYKLQKLPTRSECDKFDTYKPSRLTVSPKIRKIAMKSPENVYLLLESGDVMSFAVPGKFDMKAARNIKFQYIWRAFDSNLRAVDIDNSYDGSIILCTRDGSVFTRFTSSSQSQRRPSLTSKTPSLAMTSKNKFRKLEGVNRVVKVSCDDHFVSFGFMRDETDLLPLKLQKNDFKMDINYLSVLSEVDSYRKQDQLLDTDHDMNCYVSDFIYPACPRKRNDGLLFLASLDENEDDDSFDKVRVSDRLYQGFLQHHDHSSRKPISSESFYQAYDTDEISRLNDVLSSEVAFDSLVKVQASFNKFHDATIEFQGLPKIRLKFHSNIMACRSEFFERLMSQENGEEFFIAHGFKGSYDVTRRSLKFESDVDVRATVVFLHFIYTNCVLRFWDSFPLGSKCPPAVKRSKDHFTILMAIFQMDSHFGKEGKFIELFQSCINHRRGDLTIFLLDGQVRCDSSILAARSAFFETFLSERWETIASDDTDSSFEADQKQVNLEGINTLHFEVILRHIYGCDDLKVFDCIYDVVSKDDDSDDFINFLLDMIEISDKLLLIQLKHLSELAIKDLITYDNVLLLLTHSFYLSASKLFKSCCWCIFNNLDILIFEPAFRDLDQEILAVLEREMRFLQLMKQNDFVVGDRGEVNLNLIKSLNGPIVDVDALSNFANAFNDTFLTDDLAFKPIFDQSPEPLGAEEKKRRSSSRKLSRRNSSIELPKELQNLNISKSSRKVSESAIADDITGEDDFEMVTSRRRRKSKMESNTTPASQYETSEMELSRGQLFESSKSESSSPPPLAATLGTKWSAREVSTSPIESTPLGPTLGDRVTGNKLKSKIKFSGIKPSQKQRRKLGDFNANQKVTDNIVAPTLKNPWKAVSPSAAPIDSASNLPVLGSANSEAGSKSSSMTAIMLEESMKIERQKQFEGERKSLQEIQQEQEFAKWWEEESRRVQLEMRGPKTSPTPNGNGQKHNRGRRPRNGKKSKPV